MAGKIEETKHWRPRLAYKELPFGNLSAALTELIGRQNRTSHPDGAYSSWSRVWLAAPWEFRDCCYNVQLTGTYSLQQHCRTISHVAALFVVDNAELQREYRKIVPVIKKNGRAIQEMIGQRTFDVTIIPATDTLSVVLTGASGHWWPTAKVTAMCDNPANTDTAVRHLKTNDCGCGIYVTPVGQLYNEWAAARVITKVSGAHDKLKRRWEHAEILSISINLAAVRQALNHQHFLKIDVSDEMILTALRDRYGVEVTTWEYANNPTAPSDVGMYPVPTQSSQKKWALKFSSWGKHQASKKSSNASLLSAQQADTSTSI